MHFRYGKQAKIYSREHIQPKKKFFAKIPGWGLLTIPVWLFFGGHFGFYPCSGAHPQEYDQIFFYCAKLIIFFMFLLIDPTFFRCSSNQKQPSNAIDREIKTKFLRNL